MTVMDIPIMTLDINNEMDIMLAHRRGLQFAKFLGIGLSEQTRFATAISEICRNCVEYAGKGIIGFSVLKENEKCILSAVIKDKGKGITNLSEVLERKPEEFKGRGLGIVYAKRLADEFGIRSNSQGTTVVLQKIIPSKTAVVNNLIVEGWVKHLQNEPALSAYEEIKVRNSETIELYEELKVKTDTVEKQMQEIGKLNDKLSKSNHRLKEFTYAISHDLKTPLSSLRIASDYAISNPLGEDLPEYMAILSRSVKRLDKTIHSLIEILDMQDQDNQIVKELNFASLFQDTVEEYHQFIEDSEAIIQTDFEAAPTILYVEAYLRSLFSNLLSNSLKYRDPERPLSISIVTEPMAGAIRFRFTDTGAGMDLDLIKDRLFRPFTRFTSGSNGKGIGLYLIKGMVEGNGGTVIVESTVGRGTAFVFTLVPHQ